MMNCIQIVTFLLVLVVIYQNQQTKNLLRKIRKDNDNGNDQPTNIQNIIGKLDKIIAQMKKGFIE